MLREPLGPIEQIFPQIPAGKIARSKSTNELFLDVLASRYFALKVGGDYVRRDLVARIRRVSAANSLSATTESVKDARARYHPLLWVGIRVGNRAWADQVDGLTNVIESLQKEFSKLGGLLTGFRCRWIDQSSPVTSRANRDISQGKYGRQRRYRKASATQGGGWDFQHHWPTHLRCHCLG